MNTLPSDRPLRILVVDRLKPVREEVRKFCSNQPGLCVIAEAWDGREALDLYRICRPDVVIINDALPGADGVPAATLILEQDPHARILPLAAQDETLFGALINLCGSRC